MAGSPRNACSTGIRRGRQQHGPRFCRVRPIFAVSHPELPNIGADHTLPCVRGLCRFSELFSVYQFPIRSSSSNSSSRNSNLPPRVPWPRFAGRCDRYHRYRSTPSRALSILWCFLLPWPKPPLQPSWLVKTCATAGRDSVAFFIIVL